MRLFYTAIFLFSSIYSYGQISLAGKITNDVAAPVKYATIELIKDTVLMKATSSDSLGHYQFSGVKAGKYSLLVSYLNSEPNLQALYLRSDTTINIRIKGKVNMLNDVIITSNEPTFIAKAGRFVFTPGRLFAQGSSGLDILQHTPLIKYDVKSETLAILNKHSTVIYINNKKTRLPREMILEMLKALPAENIKSVEIITNPGSEYEANLTGGIININIKRQLYEGWLGNLSITSQQSNYNTTVLNGAVNYRKGKIALQIIPFLNDSYNYTTRQNVLDYRDEASQKLDASNYRRYVVAGGGVNFDYDIDSTNNISYKGWISNVNGHSTTGTTTAFSSTGKSSADSLLSAPYKGKDSYLYNFGNVNYHKVFGHSGGQKYLDANVDYNQFTQKNTYEGSFNRLTTSGDFLKETGRYKNYLPQNFFNLSEKLEYGQPISHSTKISAGIQYSDTHVTNNLNYKNFDYNSNSLVTDSLLTNNYKYKEIYAAAYLSLNADLSKKVSASIGLRFENTRYKSSVSNDHFSANNMALDTNYFNLFPSLSLSYAQNQQNQFGLSLSKKISRPGIESLFPGITYYTPNYYNQNNPFLQPMLYYNGELTYTYKSRFNFLLDYTLIDHAYNNFTIPVNLNSNTILKSTTLNYGTAKSFDFTFNTTLPLIKDVWDSQLSTSLDYSMYHSKIPEVSFALNNFSYNFYFDNTVYISKAAHVTGFATFTYVSKQADIGSRKINANSHLDLGIKKVLSKKVSILFFANDIYKGNAISKNYFTPNALLANNYIVTNSYTQSFTLVLRFKFGNPNLKQNRDHSIANDELKNRTGQ
ncbi:outer membrane beta-barrel family protein [Mucilaginibacter flavus]|uniref:outer membrane beta-barrel family protein n=1 Tax=Mucilaginibacter flavus TaxID=931504 RepID=UPI0025B563D1|nr:outer membrane beta-barrel family protein [Mucilaginibacter flavus]MDN3580927.1 outer membrane beta-barrel family protein [Mucilaginibacter flavus]